MIKYLIEISNSRTVYLSCTTASPYMYVITSDVNDALQFDSRRRAEIYLNSFPHQ